MKLPTCVIGPDEKILMPPKLSVHQEIELAAVIGKRVRKVSKQEASEAIVGYTICNDVTAPQASTEDSYFVSYRRPDTGKKIESERRGPVSRAKNYDTFAPLGPYLVTKDEVDPSNLKMICKLNGMILQEGNTNELIFTPTEIVEYLSTIFTFEPGDIITTGTCGSTRHVDLRDYVGKVLELEIEGIGKLRNPLSLAI